MKWLYGAYFVLGFFWYAFLELRGVYFEGYKINSFEIAGSVVFAIFIYISLLKVSKRYDISAVALGSMLICGGLIGVIVIPTIL